MILNDIRLIVLNLYAGVIDNRNLCRILVFRTIIVLTSVGKVYDYHASLGVTRK